MPTLYKHSNVQGTSAVTSFATLYGTDGVGVVGAVVSTIAIANTTTNSATFRIGITNSTSADPGLTNSIIAWDSIVAPNDTIFLTVGVGLAPNRFIRVSSSANTVVFSAFVSEIT